MFVACFILTGGNLLNGQTLAFPGAEGYGKYTTGGRGGRVIEVTNLEDADRYGNTIEGSLRAALETSGDDPITIVFRVSGIIEMEEYQVKVSRSNVTIAGQTAPGDGICIKNGYFKFSGDNIIIRYIRFRPGDELEAQVSALNIENAENIMIDHCSFSWAIEENATFYDNKYTSVQWCIISESLYNSYHAKGVRGYAGQWGGQYSSYHHNLLAHNNSRSPRINGSRAHDTLAYVDIRNNVIFNWGSSGAIYGGEEEIPGGECRTNFVNNYYKPGPATSSSLYFAAPSYVSEGDTPTGYAEWYFSGNFMEGDNSGMNEDNWLGVDADEVGGKDNIRINTEVEMDTVTTYTAQEAYDSVLLYAGAIKPIRDSVDMRIVSEVKGEIDITGDGTIGTDKGIIDSQSSVGGWPEYNQADTLTDSDSDGMPDEWETKNGFDSTDASDRNGDADGDGYTNLEEYLNSDIAYIQPDTSSNSSIADSEISTLNELYVYPNPADKVLNYKCNTGLQKIELFNIQGSLIMSEIVDNSNGSLSIESLKSGEYLVKAYKNNGAVLKSIVIVQ